MIKNLKNELFVNQRAFFATLVCVCTLTINLFYYIEFGQDPAALISFFPIILWIAYDGNEKDKAITQGYWIWVLALLITTLILIIYPLF